ncbi:hypothetical protein JVX98_27140 [Ensifer sp. PDNC004]|uniref:hypothetical protein n=1 Tax=Ensifer sp. PDNC004 TaxID=2811423 RepID=UPI001962E5AE|nr:hypothetical protein [Ensifer sp. PDNC004]QRY67976.1 hypothetical protein JVX98_27140 [Ensifer sp. PDNC004]
MRQSAIIFVRAMIEAGSNIQAIGQSHYVLSDPVNLEDETARKRINEMAERFGPRDHLKAQIIEYLHELGRVIEVE